MSQANVEVVRRLYESEGSEFFELLDPHVVFINYASAPETRPYVGHDGVREWAAGFRATFGDYEAHVTEIIDAGGDQVVADARVIGAALGTLPSRGLLGREHVGHFFVSSRFEFVVRAAPNAAVVVVVVVVIAIVGTAKHVGPPSADDLGAPVWPELEAPSGADSSDGTPIDPTQTNVARGTAELGYSRSIRLDTRGAIG
jgi:hypothetical protein